MKCDNEAPQTGVFKKWLNNTLGNNTIECKNIRIEYTRIEYSHRMRVFCIQPCYYPKCYSTKQYAIANTKLKSNKLIIKRICVFLCPVKRCVSYWWKSTLNLMLCSKKNAITSPTLKIYALKFNRITFLW